MNFYFAFDEYINVTNKVEPTQVSNDVMAAFQDRNTSIHPPHSKTTTIAQQWVLINEMWDGFWLKVI